MIPSTFQSVEHTNHHIYTQTTTSFPQIIDALLVAISILLIILYHIWYYSWRFYPNYEAQRYHRVDITGQRARQIFVRSVIHDSSEGSINLAIQACRNPITAESILATGATVGITTLINIMLDEEKMAAVRRIGKNDPLIGHIVSFFSPEFKLALAVGVLCLSFFSFAQSLRLYIHFGFFARASQWCKSHPDEYTDTTITMMTDDAYKTLMRAQTYFSAGLRFTICLLPLIFWLMGSTYFVLGTVAMIIAFYHLDQI